MKQKKTTASRNIASHSIKVGTIKRCIIILNKLDKTNSEAFGMHLRSIRDALLRYAAFSRFRVVMMPSNYINAGSTCTCAAISKVTACKIVFF